MTGSLRGTRIVSTAVNVPGPAAASMLHGLGARIVKVEPPGGDPLSCAAPGWYSELCEGLDVLRLDLKSVAGRERLDDLLGDADVLLTSTRQAALKRLGLSWEDLHARHARVCLVSIVGYAAPREEMAGHDLTYQAASGLVVPPAMPRTLLADLAGAQRAVTAVLDLLLARERSGEAGCATVALVDCGRLFAAPLRHGLTSPTGLLGGGSAGYNVYPTREGWVAIAALEPHFRAALGRELSVDVDDRAALARVLADRSAVEWERWAEALGLPLAAVRELSPR